MAGPAADTELELPEFLGLLVRCAFWRLNPEYGEISMEHQQDLCRCRSACAVRSTACSRSRGATTPRHFRAEVMTLPGVTMALYERKAAAALVRLRVATTDLVTNGEPCISMEAWLQTLEKLQGIGTYAAERTSDMVRRRARGRRAAARRLSLPQAKHAFRVCAAREGRRGRRHLARLRRAAGGGRARAIDKYRAIAADEAGVKVRAMIGNLLGETTEEEAMVAATHIAVPRFDARNAPPPARLNMDAR